MISGPLQTVTNRKKFESAQHIDHIQINATDKISMSFYI